MGEVQINKWMRVCFSLWVLHKGLWNGEEGVWTLVVFGGWLGSIAKCWIRSSRTLPMEVRGKPKFPLSFWLVRIQLFWGFLRKFYFKVLLGGSSLFSKLKYEDTKFCLLFSHQLLSCFLSPCSHLPSLSRALSPSLSGRKHTRCLTFQSKLPGHLPQHPSHFTKQKPSDYNHGGTLGFCGLVE